MIKDVACCFEKWLFANGNTHSSMSTLLPWLRKTTEEKLRKRLSFARVLGIACAECPLVLCSVHVSCEKYIAIGILVLYYQQCLPHGRSNTILLLLMELCCNLLAGSDACKAIEHTGACESQKLSDLTEILNTDQTGIDTTVWFTKLNENCLQVTKYSLYFRYLADSMQAAHNHQEEAAQIQGTTMWNRAGAMLVKCRLIERKTRRNEWESMIGNAVCKLRLLVLLQQPVVMQFVEIIGCIPWSPLQIEISCWWSPWVLAIWLPCICTVNLLVGSLSYSCCDIIICANIVVICWVNANHCSCKTCATLQLPS